MAEEQEFTAKMYDVKSSNIAQIGHQKGFGPEGEDVLRVAFARGQAYDYWPVSQEEFSAAFKAPKISEWFNVIKARAQYKKV